MQDFGVRRNALGLGVDGRFGHKTVPGRVGGGIEKGVKDGGGRGGDACRGGEFKDYLNAVVSALSIVVGAEPGRTLSRDTVLVERPEVEERAGGQVVDILIVGSVRVET